MAESEVITVHPGDIVQDNEGLLYLVGETHGWGLGAVMRWKDRGAVHESYHRLKPGQFVPCGQGHILPGELSRARRESLATAAELAGTPPAEASGTDFTNKTITPPGTTRPTAIRLEAAAGRVQSIAHGGGTVLAQLDEAMFDQESCRNAFHLALREATGMDAATLRRLLDL